MQRKYQLILDIHRGSMSLVCTPACNMLLNLMVIGKGNFTKPSQLFLQNTVFPLVVKHTNDVAAEKGVNPTHNKRIRNNHGHVVLHHAHHAVHGARVRERVGRRLTLAVRLLEVCTRLVPGAQSLPALLKGLLREDVIV